MTLLPSKTLRSIFFFFFDNIHSQYIFYLLMYATLFVHKRNMFVNSQPQKKKEKSFPCEKCILCVSHL